MRAKTWIVLTAGLWLCWSNCAAGENDPAVSNIALDNTCGRDIRVPLDNILGKIRADYNSWAPARREEACAAMDPDMSLSAVNAWDIADLRPDLWENDSVIEAELYKGGYCGFTVAVDGQCYRHEEVNYLMWGAMTRLCGKSLAWSKYKIEAYLRYYYDILHRDREQSAYPGEIYNKTAWTEAGYYDWPAAAGAPQASRPDCAPSRLSPYDGATVFTAKWNGNRIRAGRAGD
ncbi:MAG: hypothetical protein NTY45_08165 [Elusimicrobia bacterium]|nr:hypothetical protein [Elusimicrobiota bacterium]